MLPPIYRELLAAGRSTAYAEYERLRLQVQQRADKQYMQSLPPADTALVPMRRLLHAVGYTPEWFDKTVLVGGTYAKGTVTASLQGRMHAQQPTGAFFSPSVLCDCETVMPAPGVFIDPQALHKHYATAAAANQQAAIGASHFETLLAAALLALRGAGCRQLVLEVGCGGARDATNAVAHAGAVVTGVGYDHMPLLGDDLAAVAREKAGILPPGGWAVVGEQSPALRRIFTAAAQAQNCRLHFVEPPTQAAGDWAEMERNEQLAAQAFERVREAGGASAASGAASLPAACLPGRFDVFQFAGAPLVVDGAHNPDKCRSLAARLRRNGLGDLRLLLAVKADKDLPGMLQALQPLARDFTVTECRAADGSATMPAAVLRRRVAQLIGADVRQAESAAAWLRDGSGPRLVCGSFMLVADTLRALEA